MATFISHNKAEKQYARSLAIALVEQGDSVWFDEWSIKPGESLIGGIEEGLSNANIFVIIWSKNAAESKWVGTELKAYIRRRVDDASLRIVPIIIDNTRLPTLLADYKGFAIHEINSLTEIAAEICGVTSEAELVRRLNKRLEELTYDPDAKGDPLPYTRCPECGEENFNRHMATDPDRGDSYYFIECRECKWSESA